jgi:hypothetical protein
MKKHLVSKNELTKPKSEKPYFSKAIREIAKRELKAFELQSDEDFLTRAEIDRRLNSL